MKCIYIYLQTWTAPVCTNDLFLTLHEMPPHRHTKHVDTRIRTKCFLYNEKDYMTAQPCSMWRINLSLYCIPCAQTSGVSICTGLHPLHSRPPLATILNWFEPWPWLSSKLSWILSLMRQKPCVHHVSGVASPKAILHLLLPQRLTKIIAKSLDMHPGIFCSHAMRN